MTPRSRLHAPATLVLLVACQPLVYTLDDAGDDPSTSAPHDDTDPHDPTDHTDPNPGPTDPSCFDGARNGQESDLDCGGPCPPCPDGDHCDDPADCQSGACILGTCSAPPACHADDECKPESPCMQPVCDPGGNCVQIPAFDGDPCEDNDPCTDASACAMGKCFGVPRTCEELAGPCRKPFCNAQTGNCAVEFERPGSFCDDGQQCSRFDACNDLGECAGQPQPPLFSETFIMDQGWTLDPMWQIGPAVPTMCGMPGSDDPFIDHSQDQFLAGLLIGECTPLDGFPMNCLTSPFLGVMGDPEQKLALSYWSQLSNAGEPMIATVEWFDGQDWWPLRVIQEPLFEKEWTLNTIEFSPLQPVLQVRFCQGQMGPAMLSVGGWSIDDVTIGPAACPP